MRRILPASLAARARRDPECSHWALIAGLAAILLSACSDGPQSSIERPQSAAREDLARFEPTPVGQPVGDKPWVAHLKAVDLDQDGLIDIIACEAKDNTLSWARQSSDGVFEERIIARDLPAPVHVEEADMDGDGDLDLVVSCMGFVFPNNDKIGSVVVLENVDNRDFVERVVLKDTHRVTDARAADLDNDGILDLAVGQFGYDQGEVRWMKGLGNWRYRSHNLLNLSGAINVGIADFDRDNDLDIVAQISQQWEEIYLFENDGRGGFASRTIWGSTNEDFASSGLRIADMNQDGWLDLLFSNGDGFGPSAVPGPRPWHGTQWLENHGNGAFSFHRIGSLAGAYSPLPADLDQDGDIDVLAVSAFNLWDDPKAESLVWFENLGSGSFAKRILAHDPIQLLCVDSADIDRDGRLDLITGGFHAYPPYERMSRLMIWTPSGL